MQLKNKIQASKLGVKWTNIALSAAVLSTSVAVSSCKENKPATDMGQNNNNESDQVVYKDVHDCAGLNSCKGMGGCEVTAAKLESLAKKRGISLKEAGQPHSCSGLNACKGLGGCAVTAEQAVKLRAKLQKK